MMMNSCNITTPLQEKIQSLQPKKRVVWKVYYKLFDLSNDSEREELEGIYTESMNAIKGDECGVLLCNEENVIFNGALKVALKWAKWETKEISLNPEEGENAQTVL